MPIARNWGPSAAAVGAVAYQAGLGKYRQRKDQVQLNAAQDAARLQLAAQESDRRYQSAQQARADNAALQQQALAQREAEGRRRAALEQQALAAEQQQAQIDYQQRIDFERMRQQGQLGYLDRQYEQLQARDTAQQVAENQLQGVKDQSAWERDTATATDMEAQQASRDLREMQIKPEDDAKRRKLVKDYEDLRQQRRLLSPKAYSEVMGQWLQNVAEADLQPFTPPTPEQLFQEETYTDKDGYVFARGMRNGAPAWNKLRDPPDATAAAADDGTGLIENKPRTAAQWRKDAIEELSATNQDSEGNFVPFDPNSPGADEKIAKKIDSMMAFEESLGAKVKEARASAATEAAGAEIFKTMIDSGVMVPLDVGLFKITADIPDDKLELIFAAAPSGTSFIDPDGKEWTKP